MNTAPVIQRRAFSLLELMIAIVILGLGLVMVATMFPIAWDRARALNEQSLSQSIIGVAHDHFISAIQVADGDRNAGFNHAHLAGDFVFDPRFSLGTGANVAPSDTRVHALNMQNLLVSGATPFVGDNPWQLEFQPSIQPPDFLWDHNFEPGPDFISRTFHTPRILLHQRVYPPMRARNGTNFMTSPDPQWSEALATRIFSWAVFHRIHDFGAPRPPSETTPPITNPTWAYSPNVVRQGREAIDKTRVLDVYYVVLRRPSPTNRYARQSTAAANLPNPYVLNRPPAAVTPAPAPPAQDVLFPVAWRVQVEFPNTVPLTVNATGIPTEIAVPVCDSGGCSSQVTNMDARRMLVGMFPTGAQFIDEVNGQVYRVTKRRIISPDNDRALLTLDREVLREELDFPPGYLSCDACGPLAAPSFALDPEERIRTVWVFPPPVDARVNPTDPLTFTGPQPVVAIEVRNFTIAPIATAQ